MEDLKARVLQAVLATIDDVNEFLPSERRLERSATTQLFGERGALDSLGLVNFLVSLEGRLADEFGQPVSLVDDRALSQRASPFRTVHSLAEYATRLIEEARRDG